MQPPKYNLLTANLFIAGLVALLLNDLYLKYHFPGMLSGKLSDVAGLFIFPFFLSIFISRTVAVYIGTAVFFVFWKLEISQSFIDGLANITGLGIGRTVDLTDLLALAIMPFSYRYFLRKDAEAQRFRPVFSALIGCTAFFSFCATTMPVGTNYTDLNNKNRIYRLPYSKQAFFDKTNFRGLAGDARDSNLKDSMYYLHFTIPKYHARLKLTAKIKQFGKDSTKIEIDSVMTVNFVKGLFMKIDPYDVEEYQKMTPADFDRHFERIFITPLLTEKKTKVRFFLTNKDMADRNTYYSKNRRDTINRKN